MPNKIKRDYLAGTEIYLRQRKDMFRCNTDTALLGQFLRVKEQETLMDIGCNNGALMLYASLQHPAHLIGVDLFEEAIALAKENLEDNGILNYTLYTGDATVLALPTVEVIVSNPPYFDTPQQGHRNENEFLRAARHEGTLTLASLFDLVRRNLKENGRFYLVHRAMRLTDIFFEAAASGLRAKTMQLVYDEDREEATAVLLEFAKGYEGPLHVLKPKTIHRNKGT